MDLKSYHLTPPPLPHMIQMKLVFMNFRSVVYLDEYYQIFTRLDWIFTHTKQIIPSEYKFISLEEIFSFSYNTFLCVLYVGQVVTDWSVISNLLHSERQGSAVLMTFWHCFAIST